MRFKVLYLLPLLLAGCTATLSPSAPLVQAEAAPVVVPAPLPQYSYQVRNVPEATGCVALTFDDGPHVTLTPQLLDILRSEGIRATFYVVGQRVASWPDIVARAVRESHEIGNHSWNHALFTTLSDAEIASQLARTDAAILAATGIVPATVRLPGGDGNARVFGLIDRPVVFWDVDTLDWQNRSPPTIQQISARAYSGSIVLLHDIHATTIAAVPGVIATLRAQGLQFVTVSELLSGRVCTNPTIVAAR